MSINDLSLRLPGPGEGLPGRPEPLGELSPHYVNGTSVRPPVRKGPSMRALRHGVLLGSGTHVLGRSGRAHDGGGVPGRPNAQSHVRGVCTGRTGHAEAVLVVFDADEMSYASLLTAFWEGHDPTQGMRQGADVGSQYRSAIFAVGDAQRRLADASRERYQAELSSAGFGSITTEIRLAPEFYYAEAHHQQYLAKNPGGYCGLGGIGLPCPTPS